ncbi:hypothetical protein NP493_31g06100 [Ridgeia piscesae]|uniref:Anaphase-promoting complex subunit 4-like WD40 domain-containing protein n=1 Tax=Ridgeia piscesae TaxID=27915 RepID=A0AAD9PD81_RIDPI|nr:hypothetical protein NP493_31g06100 [Ridgeia piscesae]
MRCRSGEPPVDDNTLRSPEMDINKQRHLKGNWLAYWEHEVGLSDRQDMFDFKQIKLQTFTGHTSSVRAIQVLDNENSFMSASKDKTVKLWSLRSFGDGSERVGCQWTYNKHRKPVFTVSFIESIRLAVSNDSSVHVWDPFVGMCLRQYEASKNNPVTAMTPMASPSSCVMTATADAILRLLDVRMEMFTCEFKCTTTPAGLIRCIAPSPDGHWLAVGYSTGIISVLDARTGLVAASWKGHEGEILQMKAFDNMSFVTSSFDQSMTLWNAEDGKAVSVFKGLTEPVHCISFYRGMMLTATTAKRVGVYPSLDSKVNFTSTKLRSDTFPGVLTTMAVLPANRLLLLGADNGAIRLLA